MIQRWLEPLILESLQDTPRRLAQRRKAGGQKYACPEYCKRDRRTWSLVQHKLFHYRTQIGSEVVIILEYAVGRLVGIEVKASSTATAKNFKGLKTLAEDLPERFHRGFVVYMGEQVVQFGERVCAVPIGHLWKYNLIPILMSQDRNSGRLCQSPFFFAEIKNSHLAKCECASNFGHHSCLNHITS